MMLLKTLSIFAAAYLVGAVPFSLLLGFAWGVDIRKKGSGNVGATNVLRSCGKLAGTLAYILDVGKGIGAVALTGFLIHKLGLKGNIESSLLRYIVLLSFIAPVLGHSFSPFINFKGGKGVATAAGVLLVLMPLPMAAVLAVFFIVFLITRIISISSMIAAVCVPAFLSVHHFYFGSSFNREPVVDHIYFWITLTALLAAFIVFRHRSNISRLIKGEEHSFKKTSAPDLTPKKSAVKKKAGLKKSAKKD